MNNFVCFYSEILRISQSSFVPPKIPSIFQEKGACLTFFFPLELMVLLSLFSQHGRKGWLLAWVFEDHISGECSNLHLSHRKWSGREVSIELPAPPSSAFTFFIRPPPPLLRPRRIAILELFLLNKRSMESLHQPTYSIIYSPILP